MLALLKRTFSGLLGLLKHTKVVIYTLLILKVVVLSYTGISLRERVEKRVIQLKFIGVQNWDNTIQIS